MQEQYDRRELYQKVWEKPMLKVAAEYGVSAVALGKTCRKLSVPVPGRGHWAKLAHGLSGASKPPLPKVDKVPVIYRCPVAPKAARVQCEDPELAAIDQLLASGAFKPASADPATRPHALVRHTANLLRSRSRRDEHGILLPREPGGLDVKVTEGTLERALLVMSQILVTLERQGFSVDPAEHERTAALIKGEHVYFGIEEPIRRVVTQKPRVPNPTDRWDYDEVVTHEPTGKLVVSIHSNTWGQHELRKRWSDAKIQRIETVIPEFVAGVLKTAVALRHQEEERKRREADDRKRVHERAQLQHDIQEEEEKLEQFNQWIDEWERAERMRKFIAVYADYTGSRATDKQPEYKAWIEWARRQADRIDPFVSEKPASVLDRKRELNSFSWHS